MATKRRKRRKSCKHGKLKRSVRTRKGRKRRCKKSKRKSKKSKRKFRMVYQGPQGDCPPGMVEDIINCGYYIPCKDQNGICKTKRGKRLTEEVLSLQELATRRLLKSNPREPVFTLNYDLPTQGPYPVLPKGYYLTSPTYPGRQIDIFQTVRDMQGKQQELDNQLREVVTGNDIKKIKILLDNGANPNIIYGGKNDILKTMPILIIIAGWHSSPKTIRLLLEAGADVNIQDTYGQTPLIVAISSNVRNINTVKILLESGADPSIRDVFGNTALHRAAKLFDTEILRLLLKYDRVKETIDYTTKNGMTAIMIAASFGRMDAERVLREAGADTRGLETVKRPEQKFIIEEVN